MIAASHATRFRLPLAAPIATAHGAIEARDGVLVEIRMLSGARGFGEAMPLAGFGLESLDESVAALERILDAFAQARPASLVEALAVAGDAAPEAPAARGAVDCALHDAVARSRGVPLAALLSGGAPVHGEVATNGLVAARDPRAAAREARRLVERGHDTLKCKVGGELALDVARVASVRAAVGPSVALRLDANGAWGERDAAPAIDLFAGFQPAFVEEPLATPRPDAWRRLAAKSCVPLAADESVLDAATARSLVRDGGVRFVVVKPAVLGGLARARRVALAAQRAGARVVVTSFFDSAIGRAAALHLAASLPGPLEAAGLATADMLAADLAELPNASRFALPRSPGLGLAPHPAALAAAAASSRRGHAA